MSPVRRVYLGDDGTANHRKYTEGAASAAEFPNSALQLGVSAGFTCGHG